MRTLFALVTIATIVIGLIQCSNTGVGPDDVIEGTYPAALGTQWVYARYDSVRTVEDTVTITITGYDLLLDGRSVHVARYQAGDTTRFDTLYIRHDTVTWVSGNGHTSWITDRYVYPLQVGRAWSASFDYDSVWVRAQSAMSVPAGEFARTFQLDRTVFFLNYTHNDRLWVAPGFGVIQKRLKRHFLDPDKREQNDVWTLIEYTLPD